jgi:hypothetical protein
VFYPEDYDTRLRHLFDVVIKRRLPQSQPYDLHNTLDLYDAELRGREISTCMAKECIVLHLGGQVTGVNYIFVA